MTSARARGNSGGVKICIVGGGSTYTPELVDGLLTRQAELGLRTVVLHDVDAARLSVVGGFVRRMVQARGARLEVVDAPSLREAVRGALFVVAQLRVGGQAARAEDERLGRRYGVIGQETTGVGGLAKALRTVPALCALADELSRTAPAATLINFTNPVSIVTEALLRHGRVRPIGLCNIPIGQRRELAAHLGVAPSEVTIDSVGLNHLSFVRSVEVRGRDVLPELIEAVSTGLDHGHRPANIPDLDFPPSLLRALGVIPSDYLRYFFLAKETVAEQAAKPHTRAEEVMAVERELLATYADPSVTEKPASLAKRGGAFYSHAALEIIEAMALDRPARLVVDVANGSTVAELPTGACVEVPCWVSAAGARPLPQRPLPPALRGLVQHVKAYEELAVKAALERDKKALYLAVVTHPLTRSAVDAVEIADDIARRAWGA